MSAHDLISHPALRRRFAAGTATLAGLCLLFAARAVTGGTPDGAHPGPQAEWPRKTVITVGDIRTRIEGDKMWTLSGIDFQDTVMASEESAYGTVLTIRNAGHLGTAHFLDVPGKPGEIEKEIVTGLRFFADNAPVTGFSPAMAVSGTSFRMERVSQIRDMNLSCSVSVQDGVLTETARLQFTGPMDLQKAHPLMYAWTPGATEFAFGNADGIQRTGAFAKEGKTVSEVVKDATWMAVYNPATGKGSVCLLRRAPAGRRTDFLLIDSPGLYRKLALYALVDEIVPAGFDGTYEMASGFFNAGGDDWKQRALERLADLRSLPGTAR